ncbi:MAG TPA: exopolysaccharide biosynthesis protein, partial [Azospirillaceae bacterium]|nr:exopolysaccharide biosynthesis protein [Azospirillaceae bacterium]
PILLFAIQLLAGFHKPWLPKSLRAKSFDRGSLAGLVRRAMPYVHKLERLSRPRLTLLVDGPAERVAGLVVLILAAVLILPIFLGNMLPAIAIAVIGLALMEQDGVAMVVGYVTGAVSVIVVLLVVLGFASLIMEMVHRLWG